MKIEDKKRLDLRHEPGALFKKIVSKVKFFLLLV